MTRLYNFDYGLPAQNHIDQSAPSSGSIHSSEAIPPLKSADAPIERKRLALVVFSLGTTVGGYTYSAHILWKLLGKKGQYSEIGWFDDFHIGVLIPGSTLANALRFAESIRREIPEQVPLRYRVYFSPDSRRGDRRDSLRESPDVEIRFTPFARVYRSHLPLRRIPGGSSGFGSSWRERVRMWDGSIRKR